MIDTVGVKMSFERGYLVSEFEQEKEIERFGLCFKKVLKNNYIYFTSSHKNLKLDLHGDKLVVYNSLQTYSQGSNWGQFSYSELKDSLFELNDFFENSFFKAVLSRLDFGFNLENTCLPNMISFKGKYCEPMIKNGKKYGARFRFNDYRLKLYDKKLEQLLRKGRSIDKTITRVEKSVNYMRHLNKTRQKLIVRDLLNEKVLNDLKNDIVSAIRKVEFKNDPSSMSSTYSELKFLTSYMDPNFRLIAKSKYSHSYKKDLKKFREINEKNSVNKKNVLTKKIEHVFSDLMAS